MMPSRSTGRSTTDVVVACPTDGRAARTVERLNGRWSVRCTRASSGIEMRCRTASDEHGSTSETTCVGLFYGPRHQDNSAFHAARAASFFSWVIQKPSRPPIWTRDPIRFLDMVRGRGGHWRLRSEDFRWVKSAPSPASSQPIRPCDRSATVNGSGEVPISGTSTRG